MDTEMIGQGYNLDEENSVAKALIDQFNSKRYTAFTCLVAFASRGGITALTPYILAAKAQGVKIKVILGVDQKGTSKEALEEVLGWDVNAKVYHTQAHNIFHPKIYLFENQDIFTLIVGSNNLTERGLVQNVECSLLIKDIKSNAVHGAFYKYWKNMLDGSEENLYPITQKLIDRLYVDKIITSDRERSLKFDEGRDEKGTVSSRSLKFKCPPMQKFPAGFKPKYHLTAHKSGVRSGARSTANILGCKKVLVAEIGQGGKRWRQVNFPVAVFEGFFGAQRGNNGYNITLRNVMRNGVLGDAEKRQAVSVKSQNYRFEINCAETEGPYPGVKKRPIGVFIKHSPKQFYYRIFLSTSPAYGQVRKFLAQHNQSEQKRFLQRCFTDVADFRSACPRSGL